MSSGVWEELSRALRTSAPYGALGGGLGEVVRLPVPAAAWVMGLLAADLDRPLLVLVPRELDALSWLQGAELFTGEKAVYFPAPSLTPYQETEVSLLVRAQEILALDLILRGAAKTVVTTPRALYRPLPSKQALCSSILELAAGDEVDLESLSRRLLRFGYGRTDLVDEVGDFALRGGVFDLFPPGHDHPVRLELFGDTLESLRTFDPMSQRSLESLERIRVLPLTLFPAGPEEAVELADLFEDELGSVSAADARERIDALRDHGGFAGWEGYLPALFGAGPGPGLDELLADALVVAVDPPALQAETDRHETALAADHRIRLERHRLAPLPEILERPAAAVREAIRGAAIRLGDLMPAGSASRDGEREVDFSATTTDLFHGQLPRFPQEAAMARERGERVIVVVPEGHRRRLEELFDARRIELGRGGIEVVEGELSRGFRLPLVGVSIYGEQQLLPRAKPQRRRGARSRYGPFVSSLRDLKVGDFLVHTDHGIGQFVALRTVGGERDGAPELPPALRGIDGDGGAGGAEVMEILYGGGKRLLLPLTRLDLVQKFSGIEGAAPRLDKLGGTSWNRTKSRVRKSLRDMAGELLKLYAARQIAQAPAMPPDSDLVHQFEIAFAHEETPDQLDAVAAIKEDLERRRPMDRLLCGDVGYGKTEVAMRAAFKSVDGGFQVAVLAPTTILADQHLETFRKRFEGFPVRVEMISRFRSAAQVSEICRRLAAGEIDIVVGTHRLLSKDLAFKTLGLLIVDEEQRFGVAQKERLKQLRKDVHVLAMSATPVPRTLQLSLAGVRDLSVIETPPKDRMAVETAILPFDPQLIREAVEFELERGGQVYYVYNRVESIENMLSYLRETVPGVRITVGHGRLEERELSRRMHAFTAGEYDLLLATTIIENGIDIPNVNTMIVHRADRFGLAQLYQLRGRVGRSNQLAYCYLLVSSDRALSETARKRLAAIREFTDLGAGFRIAARDLEIRGAGNLLGAEQSGHIAVVGIETYLKMLEDSVRELKGEKIEEAPSVALDLPVPMSIPPSYVEDANLRMEIYRKIASGEEEDTELLAELTDRFGPPPVAVRGLLEVASLKRLAESLRVQSITAQRSRLTIRLRADARIEVDRLIEMVSQRPETSFSPSGVLTVAGVEGSAFVPAAREILEALSP